MIPELTGEQIEIFLLVFVRITAIISMLPIFGAQGVPNTLKIGFSFICTVLFFPLVPIGEMPKELFTIPMFVFMVVKEIMVGLIISMIASFLFVPVQFAGQMLDMQIGFSMVETIDPFSEASVTITGQFHVIIFSIIFLVMNGHYFFVLAIKKSFDVIPLFTVALPDNNVIEFLTNMISNLFTLALRFAAPVFSVMIMATLAMGLISRTVPQMNVFFVAMPIKIGLGIMSIAIALPVVVALFKDMVYIFIEDIWKILFLLAQ